MQKKTYKDVYQNSNNSLERYKIWLQEVSVHYDVKKEDIITRVQKPEVVVARQTFYWLCWKDKINLYQLAIHLGKDRTTVVATMNQGSHNREKDTEKFLYEKVTSQERKREIEKKNNIQESCS